MNIQTEINRLKSLLKADEAAFDKRLTILLENSFFASPLPTGGGGGFISKSDANALIQAYQKPITNPNTIVSFFIDTDIVQSILDQNPDQIQIIFGQKAGPVNTLLLVGANLGDPTANPPVLPKHVYVNNGGQDGVLENIWPEIASPIPPDTHVGTNLE